jgi:integrase
LISKEKNITFRSAYTDWFQSISYRIKESTAANYILKADKHILPYFGDSKISDITSASVYQFICDKQDKGLSNRYISDILILMKSVFKFASRKYHTPNPMEDIVMPKKQKSNIRLLTNDEEHELIKILTNNLNITSLGIILARMTGLRIGELCALQWKNINLELKTLTVCKTIHNFVFPLHQPVQDPFLTLFAHRIHATKIDIFLQEMRLFVQLGVEKFCIRQTLLQEHGIALITVKAAQFWI